MGYTTTFVNSDSNYPENPGQFESNSYQDLGKDLGEVTSYYNITSGKKYPAFHMHRKNEKYLSKIGQEVWASGILCEICSDPTS